MWISNKGIPTMTSRRQMLRNASAGFGALALHGLLGLESRGAIYSQGPLSPKQPHFKPKAKRVIFLFMHGGPSHVDTFDYKPLLTRDDGKPLPFAKPRIVSSPTDNLLASPWKFRQYGQSGLWVSDLFPHVAKHVDKLCMLNAMHGSNSRHGGALLELHTGSDTFIRPSMGSWVTYGLGTENQDLPGYVTLCPSLSHGGVNNWSSGFLPAAHQGTPLGTSSIPAEKVAIPFISGSTPRIAQRREIDLIQEMNREKLAESGPDLALEGRIESFELAYRMQAAAPELQDISRETEETHKLYGLDNPQPKNFGRLCLMARRFAERGVRFIQCSHSYKWDQHGGLKGDHTKNALEVDLPIAGLLTDLDRRGLLDDTLVLWGGEFGRTPAGQGRDGRDHHPQAFTMWLAGGGVKGGFVHGKTDEYGYYGVEDKVHFHDLHATVLHLLGMDHKRLTYRHAGRDFRLTDVHGEVIKNIMA
jgi:hypothetical protein